METLILTQSAGQKFSHLTTPHCQLSKLKSKTDVLCIFLGMTFTIMITFNKRPKAIFSLIVVFKYSGIIIVHKDSLSSRAGIAQSVERVACLISHCESSLSSSHDIIHRTSKAVNLMSPIKIQF